MIYVLATYWLPIALALLAGVTVGWWSQFTDGAPRSRRGRD